MEPLFFFYITSHVINNGCYYWKKDKRTGSSRMVVWHVFVFYYLE